ncbi:NADH-quinone oxidoreductase subunit H [Microbacter margulisiae]|uniref:NADH-quinone oxidoreductase subunit H n=2 Tax=Microbacter margulisiae TaxID=1350067 RepID=A0A7W5DPU3_9PORP|nr:NADH-quinone oxidoreductase subunit H [Microbacter margulisiae]
MISMIQFTDITAWIHTLLLSVMSPTWTYVVELILSGVTALVVLLVCVIIMVYMERKVAGFMQLRWGPNRVGPYGLFQVIADVIKLLLKESFSPNRADKIMFNIAPALALCVSLMALAPISWAPGLTMWDTNIGVLFITAISSMGVIGIMMAGWSSNNKYSLLGAMRSGAQIVSYELSAGLSIVTAVALAGTLSTNGIIASQANGWWIIKGQIPAIIAFLVYIIASTAECNRAPFDLAEAESELTAGYHTEYAGMQFGIFYLNEYINMAVVAIIASTLFLGGWMPFHLPFDYPIVQTFNHIMDFIPTWIWFFGKMFLVIFFMMWFRWTFPRLRIDQLLKLEWKYLLPISIVNLLFAALIIILHWHL